MSLTVHHLQVSQSERVVWLCEELGIDYTLKLYQRAPIFAPADYKSLHPVGAAPVIEDNGNTIAESGACVEYIAHTYGDGRFFVKPGEKNYMEFLYWWHFPNGKSRPHLMLVSLTLISISGTMVPAFMRYYTTKSTGVSDDHPVGKRLLDKVESLWSFMDARLAKSKFLAGEEFTAADIMTMLCATTLRRFASMDLTPYPNVLRWAKDCAARPAYRKAMAKADSDLDLEVQLSAKGPPSFVEAVMKAQAASSKV